MQRFIPLQSCWVFFVICIYCSMHCKRIILSFRMDPTTSAQDVHRCDLCEENMVDMLCVVCPQKLCTSCVGNHVVDDPRKHKLVKIQHLFFQSVTFIQRNDVKISVKNATKLFVHLAFLPILTSDTNS